MPTYFVLYNLVTHLFCVLAKSLLLETGQSERRERVQPEFRESSTRTSDFCMEALWSNFSNAFSFGFVLLDRPTFKFLLPE